MYYESQQINLKKKSVTGRRVSCYVKLQNNDKPQSEANRERQMAKGIVNIRLRPDQEERINAIVERSAILDTSKFVRIAVDWLLRSDIGEVIKTIVDDEAAFPDYALPKKTTGRKKRTEKTPRR
jgi:hypothetical protein